MTYVAALPWPSCSCCWVGAGSANTGSDSTSGVTHGVTLPLISVLLICCTAHCSEKGILHSQSSGALLCHQVASANHQAVRPPAPPALSAPLKGRGDCHTGSDSTSA